MVGKPLKMKKSERTRAAIEAAARRLFAEQGYERTVIRDIAAAAGIDPAMVIRYFGSKDRLYQAVLEHAHREAAAFLAEPARN